MCRSLYNGPSKQIECKFENCKFLHDLDLYLAEKFDDIGDTCPIYSTKGFCSFGVTCRFATNHLDENRNNTKEDWYDESKCASDSRNHLSSGKKLDFI